MTATQLEARRMALRGVVHVAGEAVPQYWPVRTFVHHNPLHGFEHLGFEEAVGRGQRLLGGRGYLPPEQYRAYLREGRIQLRDLTEALRPLVRDESVQVGSCRIRHGETLLACMVNGLCEDRREPEAGDELEAVLAARLAQVLEATPVAERIARIVREDQATLGRHVTLPDWCDRTLGTAIVGQVNAQMVRWCEAFLDEGHAAWPMPGRERGFYLAWKALVAHEWAPCGIAGSRGKIASLPDHPEDAVLESLDQLGVPEGRWPDYLSLELTDLPGWAGFIKWRGEQHDYPWQQAYPASLVKFLAVRLWYTRELVRRCCRDHLAIEGSYDAVLAFMRDRGEEYVSLKERAAGSGSGGRTVAVPARATSGARRLVRLARALDIDPRVLLDGKTADWAEVLRWIDDFPVAEHGPVWLEAFEAGYRDHLFGVLRRRIPAALTPAAPASAVRPQSQAVFCIDVRCEPFFRHLEATGDHQAFSFPGFFAAAIRYRGWGHEHWTEQLPAVMRARNEVREVPRSYLGEAVSVQRSRARLLHAGHTLVHELKENVVTPYVMVETLGWFYALPLIGKTLWPRGFARLVGWLERLVVPRVATSVTVEKLPPAEVEEMLAAEQRAAVWKALRDRAGLRDGSIMAAVVEALRLHALAGETSAPATLVEEAKKLGISEGELAALVEELRVEAGVDLRAASRQRERITRTGFTLEEQLVTVETVLRMIGLTRDFARLVLVCAHGSTSENNPYESALACGACGGNEGQPNARALAAMANSAGVRARLAAKGIAIPFDTHFLAGQLDTTTDRVELFDLEEVPSTHRKDVARLEEDLREAGQLASQERHAHLPEGKAGLSPRRASISAQARSTDWSQVRPEWGLSGNAAFVIGRRELTRGMNLAGRVFMHSYDHREDPTGRLLEVILTAAQLVCHWIAMEHYFSTVDNEVYGSGSKVYHNVAGRLGVMSGPWSDLRLGLSHQSLWSGDVPYHEPMRLHTVILAPRSRIDRLIGRHKLLQQYYHNRWVHLAAVEPEDGKLYRYRPAGTWAEVPDGPGSHAESTGKESGV